METNGTNGHSKSTVVSAATQLRGMLTESNNIIVAPGVYDGFSARIALEVGFKCIYMVSIEFRKASGKDSHRS